MFEQVLGEYCVDRPRAAFLYDISLQLQLQHPSIIKMLGYCTRGIQHVPSPADHVLNRQLISVFEYGEKFKMDIPREFSEEVKLSLDLLDMMDYLSNSPIGPIFVDDFNDGNLMLMDGHLKIADLEAVWSTEERCGHSRGCYHNLECVEGECVGHNARRTVEKAKHYLRYWLAPDHSLKYKLSLKKINVLLEDETVRLAQLRTPIERLHRKILRKSGERV